MPIIFWHNLILPSYNITFLSIFWKIHLKIEIWSELDKSRIRKRVTRVKYIRLYVEW